MVDSLGGQKPTFHTQITERSPDSCPPFVRTAVQMKGRWESNINMVPIYVFPKNILLFPEQNYIVLSPSSYTLMYLWEIYIFPGSRSAYSAAAKYVYWSWEYVNRSQRHMNCGNWDWRHAIPRKGIHKWDFPCSVAPASPSHPKLKKGLDPGFCCSVNSSSGE